MTELPVLRETFCPICGVNASANIVFPANFDAASFSAGVFSARRLPDRLHYRMVRCNSCGLLRSNPVLNDGDLAKLYVASEFTYAGELGNLQNTYGREIRAARKQKVDCSRFLEVGCGNGFMLQYARGIGFDTVAGIEPSVHAVNASHESIRNRIVQGVLTENSFVSNSFDMIALFQVFDHLPDPAKTLEICHDLLVKNGILLLLNHNEGAISARLLGERSPIIDIEHTFLYRKETIAKLVQQNGFNVLEVRSINNQLSFAHLAHLVPLPVARKITLKRVLKQLQLNSSSISLPLGNLCLVAQRA